jgi:uncharacterized membrane protein
MNLAHVHLLLNHFPTVGTVIALGLFLLSLVKKNDDLKRASLGVFCFIALVAIPVYQSGKAAEQVINGSSGVSKAFIETHENAALQALVFMMVTGVFAWFGLWQFRRSSRPAGWVISAVLVFSAITLAMMTRAATLGGEIRHPEIVAAAEVAATNGAEATDGAEAAETGWLTSAQVAAFVNEKPWVWSSAESLHFIGLCFLFGAVSLVNLRMLGMMKNTAFDGLPLLPLGLVGFGINVFTGMLFFIATPGQYTENIAFHWKMAFILLGGANLLFLMLFDEAWTSKPGDDTPMPIKVIAGSTIFLWIGVIYFGRMLPFLGNSF